MSLSSQLLTFLAVAVVYIGFTFLWGWYKGRQEDREEASTDENTVDTSGGGR
ncbi:MAG: hypothetical protein ABEJ22_06940 [Haloferacaceae archaeon]